MSVRQDSVHMRLSIRELLALTFFVALGLLVWRMREGARQDELRLAGLRNEVVNLEGSLWLHNPPQHQGRLRIRDEHESLHAVRERAVAHFDSLGENYSAIEPVASDVLSLRFVPRAENGARTGTDGFSRPRARGAPDMAQGVVFTWSTDLGARQGTSMRNSTHWLSRRLKTPVRLRCNCHQVT